MKIHSIYDSGDDSIDRYVVYFKGKGSIWWCGDRRMRLFVLMRAKPFHPQGFCQHGYGQPGSHNGKRIKFEDLPADCQAVVKDNIED